eukprot:403339330
MYLKTQVKALQRNNVKMLEFEYDKLNDNQNEASQTENEQDQHQIQQLSHYNYNDQDFENFELEGTPKNHNRGHHNQFYRENNSFQSSPDQQDNDFQTPNNQVKDVVKLTSFYSPHSKNHENNFYGLSPLDQAQTPIKLIQSFHQHYINQQQTINNIGRIQIIETDDSIEIAPSQKQASKSLNITHVRTLTRHLPPSTKNLLDVPQITDNLDKTQEKY